MFTLYDEFAEGKEPRQHYRHRKNKQRIRHDRTCGNNQKIEKRRYAMIYGVIGRIEKSEVFLALCPSTVTLVYIPHIDRHKYEVQFASVPSGGLGASCARLHNV